MMGVFLPPTPTLTLTLSSTQGNAGFTQIGLNLAQGHSEMQKHHLRCHACDVTLEV